MLHSQAVFDPSLIKPLERLEGEHRIQRVSPTEKRGRRHSSTVTIIILEDEIGGFKLHRNEVKEEYYRASGKGGQNRNKVETAVRLVHEPTNTIAIAADERSQWKNRQIAWKRLEAKLQAQFENQIHGEINQKRANTFGNGRTWSWTEWRDEVRTPEGRKYSMKQALSGKLASLLG